MRLFPLIAAVFLGMGLIPAASAQVVLPNSAAAVEGSNLSATTSGLLGTGAFTNQYLYTSPLLSGIPVGWIITGFTVRVDGANAAGLYPATTLSWANYDVTLAQANVSLTAFGSSTSTASNMLNPVQVRSGALTINAGSFTANGPSGPNPFGLIIQFATPYTYTGGDLVFLVSHSTATGTGFTVDASNADFGYSSSALWAQRTASSYGATTVGATTAGPVVQMIASAPEPGPLSLGGLALAGGLLTAARRRFRRR